MILKIFLLFAGLIVAAMAFCPGADNSDKKIFLEAAKAVLEKNWVPKMNSTLPSPNLYPHQWSWDAAFVAIGYSHYDTGKAIDETNALFRGQWRNGAVPHIVFNPNAAETYFPGPSLWKIFSAGHRGPLYASTSGIVQPPVHAIASLAIFTNAAAHNKAMAFSHLEDIYPKLVAWHDYLYRERDILNRGLVYIRHMWESGMDNSPAWDPILDFMTLADGDVPTYTRVDKGKVANHDERPSTYFYDRAVHLIKVSYDNDYDEARIAKSCRFLVEDVLFNSILARAGVALGKIAKIIGKPRDSRAHIKRADWTAIALSEHLYDKEDGYFYDYDLVSQRHIKTRISGGIAGVFGASLDESKLQATLRHLLSDDILGSDLSSWTIPSVARDDPGYTNTTYWKGPAWINVNYLVRDGLGRIAKDNDDAIRIVDFLRDRSIELMMKSGFYEYFNTLTGSAHGGHSFSWSAALGIDMICRPNVTDDAAVPHWTVEDQQKFEWSLKAAFFVLVLGLMGIVLRIYKGYRMDMKMRQFQKKNGANKARQTNQGNQGNQGNNGQQVSQGQQGNQGNQGVTRVAEIIPAATPTREEDSADNVRRRYVHFPPGDMR